MARQGGGRSAVTVSDPRLETAELYKAELTRKVPGRKGMSWEEEKWVDDESTAHRGPDDIRGIRAKRGLSQSEFALPIGVSCATLQNWEQGRRLPEDPARALLRIAA